jgi:poly(A) polymerase
MLRAVALASRIDFAIDPPLDHAIRLHRREIARSSPPRLVEEYYKILRAGSSERTFRSLHEIGLLEPISIELHRRAGEQLWRSLAELDAYRRQFESTPETLSNPILLGSLIVPLGIPLHGERLPEVEGEKRNRPPALKLGELPLARGDVDRLRQILALQRRLRDVGADPRAKRSLVQRGIFREALIWLEIHGGSSELAEHWRAFATEMRSENEAAPDGSDKAATQPGAGEDHPFRRRRRRRRGRRRGPRNHT